jgi:hypothetical protein
MSLGVASQQLACASAGGPPVARSVFQARPRAGRPTSLSMAMMPDGKDADAKFTLTEVAEQLTKLMTKKED